MRVHAGKHYRRPALFYWLLSWELQSAILDDAQARAELAPPDAGPSRSASHVLSRSAHPHEMTYPQCSLVLFCSPSPLHCFPWSVWVLINKSRSNRTRENEPAQFIFFKKRVFYQLNQSRQVCDRHPALHWSALLPPLAPSHLVHSGETPWDPRAHQNQPRCPLLARPPTTAALCTRFAAVSLPAYRLSASELLCVRHCFSAAFSFATLYTHSALLFACTHVAMHARATAAP